MLNKNASRKVFRSLRVSIKGLCHSIDSPAMGGFRKQRVIDQCLPLSNVEHAG